LRLLLSRRTRLACKESFETNSALWGGVFNFIVPLLKQFLNDTERNFKTIPAKAMLKGLVEAFQTDY
jgi:hypothetical protein